MAEKDDWGDIEVPEEEVEYEVEQDEPEEVIEEQPVEAKEAEETPELEGIETKGAEKRIRQLVQQRKEREEQIENLILQNEELKNNLNSKDKEVDTIASRSLNASEKHLTQNIELARHAYMEAFDEGDKEKVLQAQEILNEAQLDLKTVKKYQNNAVLKAEEKEKYAERPASQQPIASDPKANEWAERNSWFGEDTIKTASALALDVELKGEGYDPNDKEFYEEIDRRLETAFGQTSNRVQETEKQSNSGTSKPAQVVSGASRSSPSTGKKIKLSKEDVRLANNWGIPLEQYAAEKLKISQADGEYTTVNM